MKRLTTPVESELVTAVNEGADMLEREGIDYRLVGTAALRLMGYDVPWGGDVDFLCQRAPAGAERSNYTAADRAAGAPPPEKTKLPSGGKADFIDVDDEGRRAFFTHPATILPVGGVARPVLSSDLTGVLGLKAWAGRPKDREFFERYVGGEET